MHTPRPAPSHKPTPTPAIDIDINLARAYSTPRYTASRRSSSVGQGDVHNHHPTTTTTTATTTPASSYMSVTTRSLSARVPSMPDLTPLPSPVQSSPPVPATSIGAPESSASSWWWLRRHPSTKTEPPLLEGKVLPTPTHPPIPTATFDPTTSTSPPPVHSAGNTLTFPRSRISPPIRSLGPVSTHFSTPSSSFSSSAGNDGPTSPSTGPVKPLVGGISSSYNRSTHTHQPQGQATSRSSLDRSASPSFSPPNPQAPSVATAAPIRFDGLARKRSVSFNSSSGWPRRPRTREPKLQRELHLILPELTPDELARPSRSNTPIIAVTPCGKESTSTNPGNTVSAEQPHTCATAVNPSRPSVNATAASPTDPASKIISIIAGPHHRAASYTIIRPLGKGTFSTVVLGERITSGSHTPTTTPSLVAIKIVALQAAGGASEDRIELSLKREVDIIRSLRHPSIVKLHASEIENRVDRQAIIVLDYCRGGDLFDLASEHGDCLTAPLVRRIFAELVAAVRYLHQSWVVHRDIKLENILLNYAFDELPADPTTFPHPIIALTDLGLSRRLPDPPEDVMLTTRCGSEDYAAPEILLGQRYDGRSTDAWACAVVLYALVEGRLPFDPPARGRGSRTRVSHRIARCEWGWHRFATSDGEWAEYSSGPDAVELESGQQSLAGDSPVPASSSASVSPEEPAWRGARDVVAGLLCKVSHGRLGLDAIAAMDWLNDGIVLPTGAADAGSSTSTPTHHSASDTSSTTASTPEHQFGVPAKGREAAARVDSRISSRVDSPHAAGSASSLAHL